jgi:peptide/nickel transport system permease protein
VLGYLGRRLLFAAASVAAVVLLTFLLVHAAPGEPMLGSVERTLTSPAVVARQRALFGLDRPLPVQFVRYVANLARGQLGESFVLHRPVAAVIGTALPNTLLLGGTALALALVLGVGVGVMQAARRHSLADTALGAATLTLYSIPVFWLGLMLLLVFGQVLHWLPVGGMTNPATHDALSPLGRALDVARHLLLPAASLGLVEAAAFARFQRSALLESLGGEFIRAARAKGLSERMVLLRHALRGALAPTITLAGLSIPYFLAGSVLVESIFGWPGLGRVAYDAIFARDYNVIVATALVAGVLVALGNLIADLGVAWADPRVRLDR